MIFLKSTIIYKIRKFVEMKILCPLSSSVRILYVLVR